AVETMYREQMGYQRSAQRTRLSTPLPVDTDRGPGFILDVSGGGLALILEHYLGPAVDVRIWGRTEFPFNIAGEVRWGVPYGEKFLLGLKFTSIQKEEIAL